MNNVEALVEKNPEIRGIRCRFVFSGKNGELTPDFAPGFRPDTGFRPPDFAPES